MYMFGLLCNGNDFYLYMDLGNFDDIVLMISGGFGGMYFFNFGIYYISINFFGMGGGIYSVIFDCMVMFGLLFLLYNFGQEFENDLLLDKVILVIKIGDFDVINIMVVVEGVDVLFFSLSLLLLVNDDVLMMFEVIFNVGMISGLVVQVVCLVVVWVKGVSDFVGMLVLDVLFMVQGIMVKCVFDIVY